MAGPDTRATVVRWIVAAAGVALAVASAAWIAPAMWPVYGVFFAFALAFSFVWLDSDAPASVAYMATATAFVYIAGFPILFFELVARLVAYPLMVFAARREWLALPRPLRPLFADDPLRAARARLDLAAMLGLATLGSGVRVAVVQLARAAGIESPIAMIALGEPIAYAVMGALSARLPLPTGDYVVAAPLRLPPEDERVDVIFSAVLIVPFLVLLIVYGWREHGLVGAAAWSVTSLAPHGLVQLLVRRRHLLDERHAALERATAEIAAYTYAIAHDLRPRLASITLTADILRDPHRTPDEMRADAKRIGRIAVETEKMIADLLNMVRIVSEPEPVAFVDLGAVITDALEVLEPQLAARRVRVDVATPLPAVPGQATKLRHAVANLLGNAIRFVPAETGKIGVSALREDGAVELSVRDNGVGIPPEYHQAIFEMFRRVPNGDGGAEGSGMGLAIVKRIVEGHGGRVWVESASGVGTTFRVRLPL
jgi:signal transduction histidine kinase